MASSSTAVGATAAQYSCKHVYAPFDAEYPNSREAFDDEKHAAKVPKQHHVAPHDLDQKFNNSQCGIVLIEAKLLEFGARD